MSGALAIKVGCCGFAGSQPAYFRLFDLIEIQQTFYQLPRLSTAEKWRAAAPAGFEFTLKAWQLITHKPSSPTYRRLKEPLPSGSPARFGSFRPTREVLRAWERTAEFARALGASKVVFQSPASFGPTKRHLVNLKDFFTAIDRAGFDCVWEPRGHWPEELVASLCGELELTHGVDPFHQKPLAGERRYFRLHGVTGNGYRYTDEDLRRVLDWAAGRPSCVLFNNVWMKEDARRFRELLRAAAQPCARAPA